ncbi:MAG: flgB [Chlamydiales bacterium]|jgi:flagellar basal-body rod protein FlgB|nr:flgB [Chlamydiales bacterium]
MTDALMGNNPLRMLKSVVGLHAKRHEVIAGNVANVNTPYYRRREFRFEEELKQAIENKTASFEELDGSIERPKDTVVRNNGNDVDIDDEIVAMNKNTTLYGIYTQIYQQRASQIKHAIRGGR